MTQINETQEPWDVEDARRVNEISFDQEIEAAIRSAKEAIEAVCTCELHPIFGHRDNCRYAGMGPISR